MENFAQRVRQLRKESGKTQTQMAAVFEISARQYQNYEGGGHYPDVPGLMKMADYFGVTTDYLLGRSDQDWGDIENIRVRDHIAPTKKEAIKLAVPRTSRQRISAVSPTFSLLGTGSVSMLNGYAC